MAVAPAPSTALTLTADAWVDCENSAPGIPGNMKQFVRPGFDSYAEAALTEPWWPNLYANGTMSEGMDTSSPNVPYDVGTWPVKPSAHAHAKGFGLQGWGYKGWAYAQARATFVPEEVDDAPLPPIPGLSFSTPSAYDYMEAACKAPPDDWCDPDVIPPCPTGPPGGGGSADCSLADVVEAVPPTHLHGTLYADESGGTAVYFADVVESGSLASHKWTWADGEPVFRADMAGTATYNQLPANAFAAYQVTFDVTDGPTCSLKSIYIKEGNGGNP